LELFADRLAILRRKEPALEPKVIVIPYPEC
jgi:hypothetical protein